MLLYAVLIFVGLLGLGRCQCTTNGYFPHETQCDSYYECRNGTRQLPEPAIHATSAGRGQLPPVRWGMYADEANCGKFYNCVDGHGFPFDCPEGLAYNERRGVCDWPDLVERCDVRSVPGLQVSRADSVRAPGLREPSVRAPARLRQTLCVRGHVLRQETPTPPFSCDEGTVFNPSTRTCDDPVNVPGCENYYGAQEDPFNKRQNPSKPGTMRANPLFRGLLRRRLLEKLSSEGFRWSRANGSPVAESSLVRRPYVTTTSGDDHLSVPDVFASSGFEPLASNSVGAKSRGVVLLFQTAVMTSRHRV
ncbi:hypothetical protein MRX96_054959 [Rhipicephalus microplus]